RDRRPPARVGHTPPGNGAGPPRACPVSRSRPRPFVAPGAVRSAPDPPIPPVPPPGRLLTLPSALQITAPAPDPPLLDLPWHIPLEDWPEKTLAALPRGISRHVVRFVRMSGQVLAVKEIGETVAYREYELLRDLGRLDVPSVEPVGVITG